MAKVITSLQNLKIKKISKLLQKKYRDQSNFYLVEGEHLVQEALKANIVEEIFTTSNKIQGTLVSPAVIKKLSSVKTAPGIVALCKKKLVKSPGDKVLALNNVQDPGNVGTLIRSARAFGWDTVLVQGVDIYSPKVIRASQGAFFNFNVWSVPKLDTYFKDYQVIGAVANSQALHYQEITCHKPYMLILGNEAHGIDQALLKYVNDQVYIPIAFESLNVAQAGAILLAQYR